MHSWERSFGGFWKSESYILFLARAFGARVCLLYFSFGSRAKTCTLECVHLANWKTQGYARLICSAGLFQASFKEFSDASSQKYLNFSRSRLRRSRLSPLLLQGSARKNIHSWVRSFAGFWTSESWKIDKYSHIPEKGQVLNTPSVIEFSVTQFQNIQDSTATETPVFPEKGALAPTTTDTRTRDTHRHEIIPHRTWL